jgi:hypothetical protein
VRTYTTFGNRTQKPTPAMKLQQALLSVLPNKQEVREELNVICFPPNAYMQTAFISVVKHVT